jgi:hypothetical protein
MAQAARSDARGTRTSRAFTPAQRGAMIARRSAARRSTTVGSAKVEMVDPAMLAACVEAAGFAEHAAY